MESSISGRMEKMVSPVPSVFRVFDDGYTVRSMNPSETVIPEKGFGDLGFVITVPDLSILLDLTICAGGGSPVCYVGEFEGRAVASMVQAPWGENVYYVGCFFVDEKFRRRGFGSRLLNVVAKEHAGNAIVVLDAVDDRVVKIYKSWGYKEAAFKLERFMGVAQSTYNVNDFDGKIVSGREVAFEEIIRYDNKCFVSRDFPLRREFLRKLMNDVSRAATFVALTGSGSVVGYGYRRPCIQEGHHVVGPLYADDIATAEAIMAKLCSGVAGDNITIDTCHQNESAAALAKKFRFEHVTFLRRMHRNGDPEEVKSEVYAVTSTQLCGF